MRNTLKDRLIKISLPTLVFAGILYAGFYVVWRLQEKNTELCKQFYTASGAVIESANCDWFSIYSTTILFYVGGLIVPIVCLMSLLIFSANSRILALEKRLEEEINKK